MKNTHVAQDSHTHTVEPRFLTQFSYFFVLIWACVSWHYAPWLRAPTAVYEYIILRVRMYVVFFLFVPAYGGIVCLLPCLLTWLVVACSFAGLPACPLAYAVACSLARWLAVCVCFWFWLFSRAYSSCACFLLVFACFCLVFACVCLFLPVFASVYLVLFLCC